MEKPSVLKDVPLTTSGGTQLNLSNNTKGYDEAKLKLDIFKLGFRLGESGTYGDGLTAAKLTEIAMIHLESLEGK